MLIKQFIITLSFMRFTSGVRLPMNVRELRFDYLRQCPGTDNLAIVYRDLILTQTSNNKIEVDGTIVVKKDIGNEPVNMAIEFNKCASKSDIATCEYYSTIKLNDLCSKTDMLGFLLNYSNIPKKCPVPRGEYIFNHTTGDLSVVGFMPLFNSFWKAKTTLTTSNNKLLTCMLVDFNVYSVTRMVKV